MPASRGMTAPSKRISFGLERMNRNSNRQRQSEEWKELILYCLPSTTQRIIQITKACLIVLEHHPFYRIGNGQRSGLPQPLVGAAMVGLLAAVLVTYNDLLQLCREFVGMVCALCSVRGAIVRTGRDEAGSVMALRMSTMLRGAL